jgi:hypothetical protein
MAGVCAQQIHQRRNSVNGDTLSEVLLAAVTLAIAWREIAKRPGIAIGMSLIGVTALLGALLYSGIAEASGPHQFASMVTACAGFPLLAFSLRWTDGTLATRISAAARFILIIGAFGVLFVTLMQFSVWGRIAPALSALLIMISALQSRRPAAIAGGALLIACFALSLANYTFAPLNATQQFHVLMAIALALLALRSSENNQAT